jgi:hypothetical protein
MARFTNSQLISRIALLEAENSDLKDYIEVTTKLLPPGEGPLVVRVEKLSNFYYQACQDLILAADLIQPGFKGDIHALIHNKTMEGEAPNKKSTMIKIPDEKHIEVFQWILNTIGFTVSVSEEFMKNWTIMVNDKKDLVTLVPKTVNKETTRFTSLFNKVRASSGLKGNYYKNTGLYLALPKK